LTAADRLVFAVLLVDAAILAVVELLFLPSYIGGVPFPVTAALATVTTPLLVSAAGRLSPSRGVAAAPLIVWFVTVFVLGIAGPGGDMVLLGSDWRALLLICGGTLPSAMMLGVVMGRHAAQR
jgi:hypothetical protein